jgi:hypothetical protein|tara:strand:- start:914 stop:1333 length:420 start_codon:yes stop_codon:yes gene_type:complete
MSAMSTYLENALVNHVLRNTAYTTPGTTVYVGLIKYYDAAVVEAGTLTQEISTSGSTAYNRIQVTGWDAASNGATQNTGAITFPTATADWGGVSGVIITDNATPGAGNVLLHGSLTTAREVKDGDVFKFNAGDLDVTFA